MPTIISLQTQQLVSTSSNPEELQLEEMPSQDYGSERGPPSGCLGRLFSRSPNVIPLSPTTRHLANASHSGNMRESIPIKPIFLTSMIYRESVKLQPAAIENEYTLSFEFEASSQSMVKFVTRKEKTIGSYDLPGDKVKKVLTFSVSLNDFKKNETTRLIVCEPSGRKDSVSLRTILLFRKVNTGGRDTLEVKVLQQLLASQDRTFEILEIYGQTCENGIDDYTVRELRSSCLSVSMSASGQIERMDCVICLCEQRNTLFLPCRHMCICSGCAEPLVRGDGKCPLCRQAFASIITIVEEKLSDEIGIK